MPAGRGAARAIKVFGLPDAVARVVRELSQGLAALDPSAHCNHRVRSRPPDVWATAVGVLAASAMAPLRTFAQQA